MTYQYSLTPCSYVCEPVKKKNKTKNSEFNWTIRFFLKSFCPVKYCWQTGQKMNLLRWELSNSILRLPLRYIRESKKLSLLVTSIWNTLLYSHLPAFCARSSWKNGCSAVNLRAKTTTQSLANWQITYSDEFRKLWSQTKTSVLKQSMYTQNTNHLTRSSICGLAWKNRDRL